MTHKSIVLAAVAAVSGLGIITLGGCGGGNSGGGGGGTTPPSISSFSSSPAIVTDGASAKLTGVFANGTGVITPGTLSATSGTAVSVIPPNDTTTTYTMTVTGASGTTPATATTTVQAVAAPSITSFAASPATIISGASSSLTAVFTGGTGVITAGSTTINGSVTSGTAVSVTPTTTTTYTLTVTNAAGTAVTQTATVTVTAAPPPVITSFTANPTSISSGGTSNLTATFTGGTGAITAGSTTVSGSVTSGTPVPVTPSSTTTYTLTVTNASGTAVTSTATVTVITASVTIDPAVPGIAVTDQILGMNAAAWYDQAANASTIIPAFKAAGIKAIRWPGGSWSDDYHWGYQTGSSSLVPPYMCQSASSTGGVTGGWGGADTFAQFVSAIPLAGPFDLALTANYGSDETCTTGGDPKEAAAWAAAAVADGIVPSHITVGNEEYGSWESDLHAVQHDPTTYANSVIGASGYYKLIKAQSPNTLVGVIVDAGANNGCCTANWDPTVLGTAASYYDFVEFHYYPQNPGGESDSYLVNQAAQDFTTNIKTIKTELTAANAPNTPIYVGEMGSVSSNPGKQSPSITQGLYAGQVLGEMMNDGVSRATWWIGFGNCNGTAGNDSSSLYGWQNFGAYNVFSDGATADPTCPGYGPVGTMSPTAQAFNLFQNVAVTGEHVLTPTVTGDTTDVHAYAATHSGGTALVLFNLNETTSQSITVTVDGVSNSSDVKVITYDKSIYDQTNATTPVWAPPTTTDLGTQTLPLKVTLAPWSMNVVLIQ